jgi:hypothetical protein
VEDSEELPFNPEDDDEPLDEGETTTGGFIDPGVEDEEVPEEEAIWDLPDE